MNTSNPFTHHTPGPDAICNMAALRAKFLELHGLINQLPDGRYKLLSITALEESSQWANKAAVLADPQSKAE